VGALFEKRLEQEYHQSHKAKYIRELTGLVSSVKPDKFVTLTLSNSKVSEGAAIKALSMWLKHVNRSVFGRRSKERLEIFPFIERNGSGGIHFHLAIKSPIITKDINIDEIFKIKWLNLDGAGHSSFRGHDLETGESSWFKTINDYAGLIRYLNKEAKQQRMDNLVIECMHYNN